MLGDELLPELSTTPCDAQPALLCPAHQAPVEAKRLPGPAGRRELDIGRPVSPAVGNRLHPAAHSHPPRSGGHSGCNGRSDPNPCRNGEFKGGAAAVARRDPDPAPERTLDHKPAEIEPESKASLRSVAAGRAGFLEQSFDACHRQPLPAVGDRDLEPAALDLASLNPHWTG